MLTHPTIEKLKTMKLNGMAAALADQQRTPDINSLTFEERFALLIDREETARADRRLKTRLTQAKLRMQASIEDIDYQARRNLDKTLLLELAGCSWISRNFNLIISGPTGVGKTYLANALAHKACLENHRVLYTRLPRLLQDLEIARHDGRYQNLMAGLQRNHLLILDDWGVAPMTDTNRRDLLEILDDRYNTRSTLITSQLPVSSWHDYIADPTIADAILDRFIHNAHHLNLTGESMRKTRSELTKTSPTSNTTN